MSHSAMCALCQQALPAPQPTQNVPQLCPRCRSRTLSAGTPLVRRSPAVPLLLKIMAGVAVVCCTAGAFGTFAFIDCPCNWTVRRPDVSPAPQPVEPLPDAAQEPARPTASPPAQK
jgi:hypothetical protein